jgi:hemoglobin-like flavoprotein
MTLNIDLLRQSFDHVARTRPDFTERFYDILFERYPAVRPLFSDDARAHQPAKLAGALASVVDHLDKPKVLADSLGAMGRRHVGYGATPSMYDAVGECLIAALAEAAGPVWNDELEQQWAEAYGAVVGMMLAGAGQVAAA